VVEVACGTYLTYALEMKSSITLRSETGDPDCVIIDGQNPEYYGAIFQCWSEDNTTRIEGFTITGGRMTDHYYGDPGGGMVIGSSDIIVANCHIVGNEATKGGGVSIAWGGQPTFINCDITENRAHYWGGGVIVYDGAFCAYNTVITSNMCDQLGADGYIHGGNAYLHCCVSNLELWDGHSTPIVDTENCDPTSSEATTWGSVKAMYR
jgi:polygalacturonase